MSTRSLAVRNTAFSSLGIYTEYFLGMLASIIIARHLGPADLGPYSLIIWMSGLGVAIVNAGTKTAAIKFIAELRGGDREDLVAPLLKYLRGAELWLLAMVIGIGGLAFWMARNRLVPEHVNPWFIMAVLALAVSLRAPYMFNIAVTKGFENFRATAAVALVGGPVNVALVLLAWWLDASITGYLLAFAGSSVVFFLVSRHQANKLHSASLQKKLPEDLLRRVRRHRRITAVTVGVSYLAASEVELLFLNLYHLPAAAGLFKVAYQLASGATLLVPGVFSALLLPMMANAVSQGGNVASRRFVAVTSYLTLLAAPLVAFGVLFSHSIITLLFGAAFAGAVPVFAVCLFVSALGSVSAGASSLLISADRQMAILVLLMVLAAAKIALDVVLIKYFGLEGAVIAYASVSLLGSISVIVLALHTSGAKLAWGRMLRVLLAAALAAALAWPLRGLFAPLPSLVLGGFAVALAYAFGTVLFQCWSREDIEHMQTLHQRLLGGKPRVLARVLAWLAARAPRSA